MKVLMINGSPRGEGSNTLAALREMERVFLKNGVDCEIITVGDKAIRGCMGPRAGWRSA